MKRKAFYSAGILLAFLFAGIAYTVLMGPGHRFSDDECPQCHAQTPVKGRRDTLRMTAPVSVLCGRCHRTLEDTFTHPVDIVPTRVAVPADLPLSLDGKMTCSTCHDIHAEPDYVFGAARALLRRQTTGQALCAACHSGNGFGHAEMMGQAHMKYRAGKEAGLRIDSVSRTCLSCHDGSIAVADTVTVGMWEHGVPFGRFDPRGSHPIGVDYLRAFAKNRGLRPMGALNPAIKLVNGKVSCISCHDLYSKEPHKLVMSNSGSRLCLACHDR